MWLTFDLERDTQTTLRGRIIYERNFNRMPEVAILRKALETNGGHSAFHRAGVLSRVVAIAIDPLIRSPDHGYEK